jgi:hypothetical protein
MRDRNILQKDFAIAVDCDERTIRRFRQTGKIRHNVLRSIANHMKTTIEKLQDLQ